MPNLLDTNKPIQVCIKISNDAGIKTLNKKHRNKDYTTDVLSFNIDEASEDSYYLGDIVVNKDQAKRQAKEYGNTTEEEIAQLVEHGMLHLLGIHHAEDDY